MSQNKHPSMDYQAARTCFGLTFWVCGFVYSVFFMYGLRFAGGATDETGSFSLYVLTANSLVGVMWISPFLAPTVMGLRLPEHRLSVLLPVYISYILIAGPLPSWIFQPAESALGYLALSFICSLLLGLIVYRWGLNREEWP